MSGIGNDNAGIILGTGCSTNGRRRYNVTPSLISWAHNQNDPSDGVDSYSDEDDGDEARIVVMIIVMMRLKCFIYFDYDLTYVIVI